jgi:hypothetical protein
MRKLHSAGVVPTKQAFGIGGGARAPPKGRLKGDEGVDEVGRAPLYLYLPCTFPVPSLYLLCTFPVPSLQVDEVGRAPRPSQHSAALLSLQQRAEQTEGADLSIGLRRSSLGARCVAATCQPQRVQPPCVGHVKPPRVTTDL